MTSASNPARRPSDAEWAAHLPRICQLYYGLRYTLEDTQRVIQQETGFYATLRMYKDRIRNMAVHPKKICMQKYQAMNVVAEDFQRRGISVHFIGPSGFQFFKRTPAQITKQLRRPHCLQPITLDQANDVLQQSSIQAVVEATAVGPPSDDTIVGDSPDNWQHGSDSIPTYSHHMPPEFSPRHPDALQPTLVPNIYQLPQHPPTWNHPANISEAVRPHAPDRLSALPTLGTRPDGLSLAGVNLVPERLQQTQLPRDANDSYDFVADFDALSILKPTNASPNRRGSTSANRMLPPPSSVQRRQLAVEFAAPFFLACFPPAHARDEFAFSRSRAMERFKYILTANPENQYVLPLLNWMSTVLSANDKPDLLKEFAFECCQVLDTCRDFGFPLSTPFRYMLAFCNEDRSGQDYYGAQFAEGTKQLAQLYGADHPNVLVNEYYHAWHLMMHPSGWADAKRILEACLVKSERIMGRRDLMTINCLVVLGRGCAENGLHAQAQAIFLDVLERFNEPARALQAYHLLILDRLASEEECLGNVATAVRLFHQVYDGRIRLLSASSADTRAVMMSLTNALRHWGRTEEAINVQRHYEKELDTLRRCELQSSDLASTGSSASSEHDSTNPSSMSSSRL